MDTNTLYAILGIGGLLVIGLAIYLAKRVTASLSKNGLEIATDKVSRDSVTVKEIEKSKVDIKNRKGQNVHTESVKNDSDVKIQ
jgi:hypothetical protein